MKTFYLKGMSTTKEEFEFINKKFNDYGIDLELLCDDYSKYASHGKYFILKDLICKLPVNEDVNLVCHSMGCNYGVLLSGFSSSIKSITLVSPEFERPSKEEVSKVVESTNITMHEPSIMPFGINKILNIASFIRSNEWLDEAFSMYVSREIPTTIIYSKGDKYISRDAIYRLASFSNVRSYEIDTNNHNPMLEDNEAIDLIVNQTNIRIRNKKRLG